jgi:hypothetical protein
MWARAGGQRTLTRSSFPYQHRNLNARQADCGSRTMCLTAAAPQLPAVTPAHSTCTMTVVACLYSFGALRRWAASQVILNPKRCDDDPGRTTFPNQVAISIMVSASTTLRLPHCCVAFALPPPSSGVGRLSSPPASPCTSCVCTSAHSSPTVASLAGSSPPSAGSDGAAAAARASSRTASSSCSS